MDYLVVAPDGQEYGPANVETLRGWAQENRLHPTSTLKDFQTGVTVSASAVPGIFPPQASPPPPISNPGLPPQPSGNWAQPPSNYTRQGMGMGRPMRQDGGNWEIGYSLVRSALAIVFLFLFPFAGLVTAIYSVMWAVRGNSRGHRHGPIAIGISVAVLIVVVVVYGLRFAGIIPTPFAGRGY
jgi:hypothetical protein